MFWGFLPYFLSYRLHPVWGLCGFLREPLPFFPGLLSGQGASVGSLLAVLCYWPSEGLEDGPAQSQRDLGKWRVLRPFLSYGVHEVWKEGQSPPSPHYFPHSGTDQIFRILNSVFTTEHHVAFGMLFNFSEPQFFFSGNIPCWIIVKTKQEDQCHGVRK